MLCTHYFEVLVYSILGEQRQVPSLCVLFSLSCAWVPGSACLSVLTVLDFCPSFSLSADYSENQYLPTSSSNTPPLNSWPFREE